MMSVRVLVICASLLALAPPIAAQQEADQATLVFTFAGAFSGSADLWSVQDQPVFLGGTLPDGFALGRKRSSGLGVLVAGIYFPRPSLGISGEAFFIGGGLEDSCRITFQDPSSVGSATLCNDIDGNSNSATTVMLSAGPVLRFNTRKTIKPYIRLNAGIIIGGRSTLEMSGMVSPTLFTIVYDDPDRRSISGALAAAIGMTANLGSGYQLRWEFRDNYVGLDQITGPTRRDGVAPDHELKYRHLWSFVLGVDIILERRRGRRY
jgi:hypothetical protein